MLKSILIVTEDEIAISMRYTLADASFENVAIRSQYHTACLNAFYAGNIISY